MTIEEKARAYDEALDKAKKELDACGSQDCDAARQIFRLFPELAESEDEKIRQKFIKLVKMSSEVGVFALHKWEAAEMLAWLEKQVPKSKWTEEDEDNLNMAIYFMRSENTPYSPTDVEPVVEWLCGLKQRMEE